MVSPINILRKAKSRVVRRLLLARSVDGELISQITSRNLTYLTEKKLLSVAETCRHLEKTGVSGMFVEAGCALGGSTILISRIKSPKRVFRVYDVFGLIPPPTALDTEDVHQRYKTIVEGKSAGLGGDVYYGYQQDLYETVHKNLADFGVDTERDSVFLIKGLLQETMEIDSEVAFAHIDVDFYDPVRVSLERLAPRVVLGGSIILDDYSDWGGCRKAVDEFLGRAGGQFEMDPSAGSLKLTRIVAVQANAHESASTRVRYS